MLSFFKKLIKDALVVNILLIFTVTLILIYGTLKWLDIYTNHNQVVMVPDVKGLKLSDAIPFFESNGLRYNIIDSVYSNAVAPGAIVEMTPSAGSKVKDGRIVFITLNASTSQLAAIPEVEDLSFRQAYALLRAQGFEMIEIEYIPGNFKDLAVCVERNGSVLEKGTRVPIYSLLVLKVSNGENDVLPLDSLGLDVAPVRELNSEDEKWF